MSRKRFFILNILIITGTAIYAQVSVDVRVDSLQFFIGEQTDITLNVCMDAQQKLKLPEIKKGNELVPNVEVVAVARPDTSFMNDGKRVSVTQKYTITAWDSSFYYLPPFVVAIDGKEYRSKTLALKVYTVDVDTLHLDRFNPPYGVMAPPFSWDDWRMPVAASFLLVFLLLLSLYLYYHVLVGKPIVRIIHRKKVLPPHEVAIDEIERIKAERKWAEEDSKEYYTLLTDTLRTYIRERYGFNAMEMTSAEIITRLTEGNNEEALDELRDIFNTADLVKFAKYSTLVNENDVNLMAAVDYINQTKVEVDPNAKPEPEIIKETDKERMNRVNALKVAIAVMSLASFALMAWVVWRCIDILM